MTCLACSPAGRLVAAGYADGMIRLFDYTTMAATTVLNGHRKAVTALQFSPNGMQLASGSKDTNVILWDVVAEAGVCRFKGHKDEVTGVLFLAPPAAAGAASSSAAAVGGAGAGARLQRTFLVSCGKDTLLKVWDTAALACVQTVLGARVELWALWASPSCDRVLALGSDNQLRVWSAGTGRPTLRVTAGSSSSSSAGAAGMAEDDGSTGAGAGADSADALTSAAAAPSADDVLQPMGGLTRVCGDRGVHIAASRDGNLIALVAAGKTVEVYRRRDGGETRKRVLRRLQRAREKMRARERERAGAAAAAGAAGSGDAAAAGAAAGAGAALSSGSADPDLQLGGTSLAELEALLDRAERERAEEEAAAAAAASSASFAAAGSASSSGLSGSSVRDAFVTAGDEWELVGAAQASHKIAWAEFLQTADAASTAGGAAGRGGAGAAGGASASGSSIPLLLSLHSNQLQLHTLPLDATAAEVLGASTMTTSAGTTVPLAVLSRSIAQQGHRSDVRAVAVSSDGALVLSGSLGQAKVWSSKTGSCVRTLDLGAEAAVALCVAFGPGDRHAIVGTKAGALLLFDLASGDLLERHDDAHEGALWSLALRPDGKGLATGSADKAVKFWDFDLRAVNAAAATAGAGGAAAAKGKAAAGGAGAGAGAAAAAPAVLSQLSLVHSRTLKLSDEVLCVRYSHHKDGTKLLLAVALLDATVKVFFDDTLKFALSLYGHKLPVMAMDISADNALLVTASADKNVKLWGLDFGDCHRSFFAHSDSVMAVSFIATTHLFVTAGKDRALKYWDGDHFEHILTLEGHKGEAWALAVSRDGGFIVSGSHDRSLRVWRRSEEQVFLDEERERAMDALLATRTGGGRDPDGEDLLPGGAEEVGALGKDGVAATVGGGSGGGGMDGDAPVVTAALPGVDAGGAGAEASAVIAHATGDTAKGSDRLLEALAIAVEETDKWNEFAEDVAAAKAAGDEEGLASIEAPPRNPLLMGLTPAAFILKTLRAIRPSDIDQVLLLLSFTDALRLLRYLLLLLRRRQGVELAARASLLILKVHHSQLSSTRSAQPLVMALRDALQGAVREARDVVGFNLAGLRFTETALASAAAASGSLTESDGPAAGPSAHAEISIGKRKKIQIF